MTVFCNTEVFTADTKVLDVINDPVFEEYGKLLLPVSKEIRRDMTLKDIGRIMTTAPLSVPGRRSKFSIT